MFVKSRSSPVTDPQPPLAELVQAAKRGDEEAFYRLMDEHKEKLYRMAFSFLRNEADALEAVQETTVRAYTMLGKLRDPQLFGTWVMRILMNYCIKERKRQDKQTAIAQQPASIGSDSETQHSRLSIDLALEQLEPKYRQIIILKYFEDWTIREIAKALRCPDSTIKTRLYKALKGLRGKLQHEGENGR